jgi:hypothetical protein
MFAWKSLFSIGSGRSDSRRSHLGVEQLEEKLTPAPAPFGIWTGTLDMPDYPKYQHFTVRLDLRNASTDPTFPISGTIHVAVAGHPEFFENRNIAGVYLVSGGVKLDTSGTTSQHAPVKGFWGDPSTTIGATGLEQYLIPIVPDIFPSGHVAGTMQKTFWFQATYNGTLDLVHRSGPPQSLPPLQITTSDGLSQYHISGQPQMPTVPADVSVVGSNDDLSNIHFTWTASVLSDGSALPNGKSATLKIAKNSAGSHVEINPQNWGKIRGGDLILTAKAFINGQTVTITKTGLQIDGSNPSIDDVRAALGTDVLRQIAHQESDYQQFGGNGKPLFGSNTGVGVMQVPPANFNTEWDWRANVKAGIARYQDSARRAAGFASALRHSRGFADLVKATNANLVAQGLPAVHITTAAMTPDQLLRDAIRGYDGFYGADPIASTLPLHEFRLKLDSNGFLALQPTSNPNWSAAIWEEVPVSTRPQNIGDPDFVEHVLAQLP